METQNVITTLLTQFIFNQTQNHEFIEKYPTLSPILYFILGNQLIITGIVFGLVGLFYFIISFVILKPIFNFFKRLFYLTVTIEQNDVEIFDTIIEWMKFQSFTQNTDSIQIKSEQRDQDFEKIGYSTIPSHGYHYFFYSGCIIWLQRSKSQISLREGIDGVKSKEELTFYFLGFYTRTTMDNLLQEAYHLYKEKRSGTTIIYQSNENGWANSTKKTSREINSVVLDQNVSNLLIEDIEMFLKSKSWYQKVGVPYRRGFMFFGPPGTGKTSFILALAGKLNYSVCLMNLSSGYLTDVGLSYLMNKIPPKSFLVIEDIDYILKGESRGFGNVTFSGLLNAIDGIATVEGRIMFITTNNPEKLESALIRPGRIDVKVKFDYSTKYQIMKLFEKFYENSKPENSKKIAELIPELKYTAAQIQSFFMKHRNEDDLFKNIDSFIKENEK